MSGRKVIDGRYIELSDKRVVFVGRLDPGDAIGIGFRNSEGGVTKLSLSHEAIDALGELLTNPIAGTFTDDPNFLRDEEPKVYRWTAVVKADAAP